MPSTETAPSPAPQLVPSADSPPKPFKCPKCPRTFQKMTGLGSHLRSEHNVIGKSKSAVEFRAKRIARGKPGHYIETHNCPKCKEKFTGKYAAQELGRHLRNVHKVLGKQAKRKLLGIGAGTLPCPKCEYMAKNKAGLSIHLSAQHGVVGKYHARHELRKQRKGIKANAPNSTALTTIQDSEDHRHANAIQQTNGYHIDPATIAVAFGRFQELCRALAVEFDVPPRMFARELSDVIHAATLRQSSGNSLRLPNMR